ncbi:MAG: immunity 26/phosphotriesterase HocA family protein [Clostridia bacterium]|nr:immunity 26/phosphotriesterase HocA family protein [Clostridia bacterium]
MFLLTNAQRACFGIAPVEAGAELRELKPSLSDLYSSYAYIKNGRIQKLIQESDECYREYTLSEELSNDGEYLLPKTARGKPAKLTAASLGKRTPLGMVLSYSRGHISLYNATSQQRYYTSAMEESTVVSTTADFARWVENWCAEANEAERAEIADFAAKERKTVRYKEGDFFRYRINRVLWGYGRVILIYHKLKDAAKIFLGKPVVIAIYRIATEDKNIKAEELRTLARLPSQYIMDNPLFYGEFEIIGNAPLSREEQDYPLHYGESLFGREVFFQCGKEHRIIPGGKLVCPAHLFNTIGVNMETKPSVLLECIKQDSNTPYFKQAGRPEYVEADLRHPKYAKEREAIFAQFGLREEDFIKKDIQK